MAGFDDVVLIQILKGLYDRQNEDDDNTYENTLIQFFEAPHDKGLLTTWVSTQVALENLSSTLNEENKTTATITPLITSQLTLVWGGYAYEGKYIDANWSWGYGGVWA